MIANALRLDPTRTGAIRKRMAGEIAARFRRLRRDVRKLLVEDDVLRKEWAGLPRATQVERFGVWLEDRLAVISGGNWWVKYVEEIYARAVGQAYTQVRRSKATPSGRAEFVASLTQGVRFVQIAAPVVNEVFRDVTGRFISEDAYFLAHRLESELKGLTTLMAQNMSRALTDGLVAGQSPEEIAARIDAVTGIGERRALLIARTETTRIHAEGILDGMERLGVDEVGVMVEWATASNPCPLCANERGRVYTVQQARGRIPLHPSCRCSFVAVYRPKVNPKKPERRRT